MARQSRLLPAALVAIVLGWCRWALPQQEAFSQPSQRLPQRPEGEEAALRVSRADALRGVVPAIALTAGAAAPAVAESGVTEPWKTKPDGSEDELHTGGVTWEDVTVGTGATPKVGGLVAINFKATAFVKEREITVDDTKGQPRDYRFGTGQMLPGMDEGILGMKTGGKRKLNIPGNLAFGNKAIPAAVGRPAVPKQTPLQVEVTLEFIPGQDDVYAYGTNDLD